MPQALDRKAFLETLTALPPSIFRIKGVIELSETWETLLFQYVADLYDLSAFSNTRIRFLTFIGNTEDADTFTEVERLTTWRCRMHPVEPEEEGKRPRGPSRGPLYYLMLPLVLRYLDVLFYR